MLINSSSDSSAMHFWDLLASFDLKQWLTMPTHTSGHTLDLTITRKLVWSFRRRKHYGCGPSDLSSLCSFYEFVIA